MITQIILTDIRNETFEITIPEFKTRFEIATDLLSDFGIKTLIKDTKFEIPVVEADLANIASMNLPVSNYKTLLKILKFDFSSMNLSTSV